MTESNSIDQKDSTTPYRGNGFTLNLLEGWADTSMHVVTGPVSDFIQHNITIDVEHDVEIPTLEAYAMIQIEFLKVQLKDFQLLKQDMVTLQVGLPAYRVIYKWQATSERPFYQEQLYIVYNKIGYRLTATFSRKTRKMFGQDIERIMLGFVPGKA